jgi:hypothetical protein
VNDSATGCARRNFSQCSDRLSTFLFPQGAVLDLFTGSDAPLFAAKMLGRFYNGELELSRYRNSKSRRTKVIGSLVRAVLGGEEAVI